jgi:arylsulfatase A-like enzyme
MRRSRALLAAGAAFVVGAIGVTVAIVSSPPTSDDRPNILLIVTDDQRADTLDVMPAVRRWFVDGGMSFSTAYATTPLCCPSRASFLTGQLLHNHGIDDNEENVATLRAVQRHTVQSALDRVGYRTSLIGKLFNNWPNDVDPAYFDRWATTPFVTYSGDQWNVNGDERTVTRNAITYLGDLFLDFASDMESEDRTPWFSLVGFMAPHIPEVPMTLEPRYESLRFAPVAMTAARGELDRSDKPDYVRRRPLRSADLIDDLRVRQLRALVAVDDQIDRMIRRLDALGELDHTLVILTSDNGVFWGEHGLFQKGAPYLEAVHVPLMLRWPGHVAAGKVDDGLVGLLDIAPTILAAARAPSLVEPDGLDLLDRTRRRERLLLEFRRVEGDYVPTWNAILTRTWIFVEYRGIHTNAITREYYDLTGDPEQLVNVFKDGNPADDPDGRALHAELRTMMRCIGVTCRR